MTKDELKALVEQSWSNVRTVIQTIREMTEEKPLVLFEEDKLDTDEGITRDEMYELPYAYQVDKYEGYNEGRIQKVEGDAVTIYFTCEGMSGDTYELQLDQIPFESLLEILSKLAERE